MRFALVVIVLALGASPSMAAVNLDAATAPPGWSFPVVPRNAPGARLDTALVTTQLEGGDTTWVSVAVHQAGPDPAGAFRTDLLLDGETLLGSFDTAAGLAPGFARWLDTGPAVGQTIGGGRHTLTVVADAAGALAETSEADNTFSRQFVWNPPLLPRERPRVRALPGAPGTLPQPNAETFRAIRPSPYAWGCAMVPRGAGDDASLRVYLDYANSGSGMSNVAATSAQSGNQVDFIVGHYAGTPTEYFPAAFRTAVGVRESLVIEQTDSQQRNSSTNSASWVNMVMTAPRLLDVYEAYFTAGRAYKLVLARTHGGSDLAFAVFPGQPGGMWARGAAVARNSIVQSADLDTVTFVASVTEWHPIAVYRTSAAALADTMHYTLTWVANETLDAPVREGGELPLAPARPNPVAGATRFAFALPTAARARLALFDAAGRRVRTLLDADLPAGSHDARWDARDDAGAPVHAGLYWARLESEGRVAVRRVVVAR